LSNWVMGEVLRVANERGLDVRLEPEPQPVPPESLAEILRLKAGGTISGSAAKEVLVAVVETGDPPAEVVDEKGLRQVSDEAALAAEVDAVLEANPDEVEAYRGGKTGLLGFFVGQVMRATGGRADPQLVNRLLRERLEG
ncbi:MAG: Asp-tRNA(Asn)/Glu-tRNA(Gln) amidotransferase GatCAB subunit B, partial [Gemmatimonadetes bacterium]|nr:Asp-tRNA(Asn)/Glu-tRNA(Gln) amidotransferase GatCAB subunit B [Gemmatimonadota bacterium]